MVTFKNLYNPPKVMKYQKDQFPPNNYEQDGYVSYSWKNIPKYGEEIDKGQLQINWNQYYGKTTIKFEQEEGIRVSGEIIYETDNRVKAVKDESNNTIYYEGIPSSHKLKFDIICDGQIYKFETSTTIFPNRERVEYYYLNRDYLDYLSQKDKFLDNLHNGWSYQA